MKTKIILLGILLYISGALQGQIEPVWKTIYHCDTLVLYRQYCKTGMDSVGNIYVTYVTYTGGLYQTPDILLTLKFGPDGNLVWEKTYKSHWGFGRYDPNLDMAVAKNGTIAISADNIVNSHEITEYMTLKYNTNGHLDWVRRYRPCDLDRFCAAIPRAVCIDDHDHIYVSGGASGQDDDGGCITITYGPAGDTLSIKKPHFDTHDFPPSAESGYAMTLDSKNRTIVVGETNFMEGQDPRHVAPRVMVYKNGAAAWGSRTKYERAVDVTTDREDNILVLAKVMGFQNDDERLGTGIYILKYSPSLNLLWHVEDLFDHDQYAIQAPLEIETDYSNNVLVTAWVGETATNGSLVTLKFSPDGEELWRLFHDNFYWHSRRIPSHQMIIDTNNNIYMGGISTGDQWWVEGLSNASLLVLDSLGNRLLKTDYNHDSITEENVLGMEMDTSGNIYLICDFNDPVHSDKTDLLLLKYDITTGTKEYKNEPFNVILYPNPVSGEFMIRCSEFTKENAVIKIYNLNGYKLLEKKISKGKSEINMDISTLKSGVYLCLINTKKGSVTKKFTIK